MKKWYVTKPSMNIVNMMGLQSAMHLQKWYKIKVGLTVRNYTFFNTALNHLAMYITNL